MDNQHRLHVLLWWAGLDLNQRCHKEPDLQSGAIPTTLYLPIWYCGRDLNSQDHVPETQMYAYSITAAFLVTPARFELSITGLKVRCPDH